jgi:hypothetical protein
MRAFGAILVRFVTRATALVLMASAFVGVVYDGTRSIANNELTLTPLGEVAFRLFPRSFMKIEPAATDALGPGALAPLPRPRMGIWIYVRCLAAVGWAQA